MPRVLDPFERSVSRARRIAAGAVLASALLVLALQALGYWRAFEARLEDELLEARTPPADVVIVAIDDASIGEIGRWPWDRYAHARMLDRLKVSGVAAIGYDVTFSEPSDEENDGALEDALRRAQNVVLPKEAMLAARGDSVVRLEDRVVPLERFADAISRRVGQTSLLADQDGIVRRATGFGSFAALLAGCCDMDMRVRRIPFYGPPGTFETFSFRDVQSGRVPEEALRGKIVLVGATAPSLHDEAQTPFGQGRPMSGVEIQANIVAGLREGRTVAELPLAAAALLYLALAAGTAWLLARLRLRYGILAAAGILLTYLLVALIAASRGLLLPVWYAALVIAAASVIELGARYVTERDRRRRIRDAFSRYLAPQVIRRIETGEVPLALGGARLDATILFSDIRGFTTLSERLDPEALVSLLNEYLTAMTTVILEEEGVVDKYIGDAIMAFWNAPAPQTDHAARAARTALRMRERLAELQEKWKAEGLPHVAIGIGLNGGEVVIGNMGSEQRFDYTAIGDEVNLASRLESLTKYYGVTILVSDATRKAAGDGFLFRRLDLVAVKGKEKPVAVHELMAVSERAADAARDLAARFEAALTLYAARRWDEAEAAFRALTEAFDDAPSRLYADRCRAFRADPPAADWDGRFTAKEK